MATPLCTSEQEPVTCHALSRSSRASLADDRRVPTSTATAAHQPNQINIAPPLRATFYLPLCHAAPHRATPRHTAPHRATPRASVSPPFSSFSLSPYHRCFFFPFSSLPSSRSRSPLPPLPQSPSTSFHIAFAHTFFHALPLFSFFSFCLSFLSTPSLSFLPRLSILDISPSFLALQSDRTTEKAAKFQLQFHFQTISDG